MHGDVSAGTPDLPPVLSSTPLGESTCDMSNTKFHEDQKNIDVLIQKELDKLKNESTQEEQHVLKEKEKQAKLAAEEMFHQKVRHDHESAVNLEQLAAIAHEKQ